mgnify:CR=1 FL=1
MPGKTKQDSIGPIPVRRALSKLPQRIRRPRTGPDSGRKGGG